MGREDGNKKQRKSWVCGSSGIYLYHKIQKENIKTVHFLDMLITGRGELGDGCDGVWMKL